MKRQMDVEKKINVAPSDEEVERQIKKVRRYSLFLFIGSVIVAIAPRLAPASRPAFVPFLPAGYGLPVTCATFTVATVVMQGMLARVLETRRRPAPAAPRLAPELALQHGIANWMFLTMFFDSYLRFGGKDYFVHSCNEWAAADLASSSNFFMITLTVVDYLARGLVEDIAAVS